MSDLIRIILESFEEFTTGLAEEDELELAQHIAEAIIAAGWPRATDP